MAAQTVGVFKQSRKNIIGRRAFLKSKKRRMEKKYHHDKTQNIKLPLLTDIERKHLEKAFEKNASIAHVGFFSLAMEALISGIERRTYEKHQIIAKPKDIEESFVVLVKGTAMSYEDDDNMRIADDQGGKFSPSTKEKNTTVLKYV